MKLKLSELKWAVIVVCILFGVLVAWRWVSRDTGQPVSSGVPTIEVRAEGISVKPARPEVIKMNSRGDLKIKPIKTTMRFDKDFKKGEEIELHYEFRPGLLLASLSNNKLSVGIAGDSGYFGVLVEIANFSNLSINVGTHVVKISDRLVGFHFRPVVAVGWAINENTEIVLARDLNKFTLGFGVRI